jgi:DNA-binding winged helix-turn-helix (wHTH) protein
MGTSPTWPVMASKAGHSHSSTTTVPVSWTLNSREWSTLRFCGPSATGEVSPYWSSHCATSLPTGCRLSISGADDFLVKPFSFSQVWGRLQSLLKRGPHNANYLRVADLELSLLSRICLRGRTRVHLTDSEFILLVELMRRHGQVLSRSMLAQRLWDSDNPSDSNVIDVNIHRIRSKIDDPFAVKLLHTVRTMGYVLEDRSEW